MSGLKAGEMAYRITSGKHKGRLAWTSDDKIAEAKSAKTKLKVTSVTENVPGYGLWAGTSVEINPKHLTKVYTVVVWSDELDLLRRHAASQHTA